jgi:hypothetical protein
MRMLYILIIFITPTIAWGEDFYLELKEGCYKSASFKENMPLNATDYKKWNKVTCNHPHHIEVFHVQRLAKHTLDDSTVSNVCVSAYLNLFDKYPPTSANKPGPYLRWFWPDDDEYKKYGSTVVCYLHAGDALNYKGLKNNPDQVFVQLVKEIKIYLEGQNNQDSEIINEDAVIAETFRVLPFNRNTLAFYRGYEFGKPEEGYGRNIVFVKGLFDLKQKKIKAIDISKEAEDAAFILSENSLSIDTAPYLLNSETRAFGFRINSAHQSWPGWGGDINSRLMFYIESNGRIIKLLDMHTSKEDWKGMKIPGKKAEISLSIQDSTNNGFRDILLTAQITSWRKVRTRAGHYDVEYKETKERRVLTFNGSKYIPAKSRPWWLYINE